LRASASFLPAAPHVFFQKYCAKNYRFIQNTEVAIYKLTFEILLRSPKYTFEFFHTLTNQKIVIDVYSKIGDRYDVLVEPLSGSLGKFKSESQRSYKNVNKQLVSFNFKVQKNTRQLKTNNFEECTCYNMNLIGLIKLFLDV